MKKIVLIVSLGLLALFSGVLAVQFGPKVLNRLATASLVSGMSKVNLDLGEFPTINEVTLTDTQRRIVTLARAEHAEQSNYTKYSEGNQEAWCADFASWIMKEAGVPYSNPNSGHWRIPGTLTLKAYYEREGRFKSISSEYKPVVGDVVLYDGDGWFGQHVNIVLENKNGKLTTVGGNENGKVRVQTREIGTKGAIGYGIFTK